MTRWLTPFAACALAVTTAMAREPVSPEVIEPIPKAQVSNPALVELGKKLFFDPRLSRSGFVSCSSCHNLSLGGTDNLRTSIGHGWQRGECAGDGPVWLLIEEQADGKLKFAFSNLPEGTSCKKAVRLWKSRWPVEQGYQQLKEELGLDHFEGRSWRGFHHHACMVLLAYGFLLLERQRKQAHPAGPGKKGVPSRC